MKMEELFAEINDNHAERLFYLRERWADEHEYEDINDYLTAIKKSIPSAHKISGEPFGFQCLCDDEELSIRIPIKGNEILIQGFLNYAEPELRAGIKPEDEPEMGGL